MRDPANRRRIVDTTFRGNDFDGTAHQDWLMEAPVLIAVIVNKAKSAARYGEKALKTLVYLDSSACIENILLGRRAPGAGELLHQRLPRARVGRGAGPARWTTKPSQSFRWATATTQAASGPRRRWRRLTHYETF